MKERKRIFNGDICSPYARKKIHEKLRGRRYNEKHYNWAGKKISYLGLHKWIYRNFGKAKKCENTKCKKKSKNYDWALILRLKYERKRENFMQLCRSCHMKYDMINIKNA